MAKTKKKSRQVAKTNHASRSKTVLQSTTVAEVPTPEISRMTFSQLLAAFILFAVTHAVVFFLANLFFPGDVVLGNHVVSAVSALLVSSAVIALISVGATPVVESASESLKTKLSNGQWMGLYLLINVASVWILARLAEEIGFGISSWLVAVILGLVINVLQGIIIVSVVSRLANRSV